VEKEEEEEKGKEQRRPGNNNGRLMQFKTTGFLRICAGNKNKEKGSAQRIFRRKWFSFNCNCMELSPLYDSINTTEDPISFHMKNHTPTLSRGTGEQFLTFFLTC
jgi:hypothetical protein